eukprot:GFKZ01007664.1.p1 GENE.GFKZ01007664.1~~GFKZ01007664.1.p1  ORF type:complete len:411 (-),score=52.93 GFKZ01007664.1:1712-2944(-)
MHPTKREVQPSPADSSSIPTYSLRSTSGSLEPVPQPPLIGPSTVNNTANVPEIQPAITPVNADSNSSALPLKRKAKDLEVPSATEFADDFCTIHGLVSESPTTRTPAEEDCIKLATEAREEYKRFRDDELDRKVRTTSVEDRAAVMLPSNGSATLDRSLTNDQKYKRRLFNNKKSSHASKVYEIVLRRAQLSRLRDMQKPREETRLRAELQRSETETAMWRSRSVELEQQLDLMRRTNADIDARLRRAQTILAAMPRIVDDLRFTPSFVNHNGFHQVGDAAFLASQAQASQNDSNFGMAASPHVGNDMLKFSSSMALSEVVDTAEGNKYVSGLTCTPSQDTEDRQLARNDPGRLIGINLLGSQTNNLLGSQSNNLLGSQSQDLPSFKTNLGSDDAVEGIFSSQGQGSGQN